MISIRSGYGEYYSIIYVFSMLFDRMEGGLLKKKEKFFFTIADGFQMILIEIVVYTTARDLPVLSIHL